MIKSIGTAARKRARARARHARAPRPLRARAPLLARRRRAAGPARHHVAKIGGVELLERDREREVLETAIEESRSAAAWWSSWRARPGSARPRSSPSLADDAPRAVGRLRPADHAAADGPAARRRARGRRARWPRRSRARARTCSRAVLDELRAPAALVDRGPALGRRRDAGLRGAARPPAAALARLPDPDLPARAAPRGAARARPRCRASACAGSSPRRSRSGAVALLAERAGREAADLHAVSGGNPFFVTEVLAAPAGAQRAGQRARRGRAARSPRSAPRRARSPSWPRSCRAPAELRLVDDAPAPAGGDRRVHRRRPAAAARRGARVPPRPRAPRGRGRALAAAPARARPRACCARSRRRASADPARLVHHARRAGDAAAIRRLAPAAARAAAAAGGHRQALEHWEAALEAGGGARRGGARGRRGRGVPVRRASSARSRRAARCSRSTRRRATRCAAGDDLRWLVADPVVGRARAGGGRERGDRAIARARGVPGQPRAGDGAQRAARSSRCSSERHEEAIELGTRAERARPPDRRPRDRRPRADQRRHDAAQRPDARARPRAARGGVRARARGTATTTTRPARWSTSPPATLTRRRDDRARRGGHRARAALRARARARRLRPVPARHAREPARCCSGDWAAAEADARASLALGEQLGVSLCPALIVLGRLQARRGEPEAGATLDEAWRRAVATQELQRLGPAAAARAEHAWLDGDLDARRRGRAAGLRARRRARRRLGARGARPSGCGAAGEPVPARPDDPRAATRCAIAGDWRGAAAAWARARLPVRARRGARGRRRRATRGSRRSRASTRSAPCARPPHLRRRLRADGVRRIPRGPRAASRGGPGRADAARDRGPRPDRAGRHQRGDRPGAGDLAQDRRPPRLGRARQARRRLPARGRGRRRAAGRC